MKYGFNGGLYLNSGTYSTPTWVDLTNTKEVQIEDGMSEHDATLRAGGGLTLSEPILR